MVILVMAGLFFSLVVLASLAHFVVFMFLNRTDSGEFRVKVTLKDTGVFFLINTVVAIVMVGAFILLGMAISYTTGVPHSLF